MELSPAHLSARAAAQRPAAISASHVLLEQGAGDIRIELFEGPAPVAGASAASPPLSTVLIPDPTVLDTELFRIDLPEVADALIVATATASWARITNRNGDWWANVAVSDADGDAPIQLETTALVAGALLRLISGRFQG